MVPRIKIGTNRDGESVSLHTANDRSQLVGVAIDTSHVAMGGGLNGFRAPDMVVAEDGVGLTETGGLRQTTMSPNVAATPEDYRQSSTSRRPN